MNYELALTDRTYSSWSLRGWLLFERFNLPFSIKSAQIYTDDFSKLLDEFVPARTVPAARLDGAIIWETLAIAEELNTRHPQLGMWPTDPAARGFARSLSAEMHAGFTHLRQACPMNLRHSYQGFIPSEEVMGDCARLEYLWNMAHAEFGQGGAWLFGDYCIADIMFAPIAARFATYTLTKGQGAQDYINAHLSDPAYRRWRSNALARGEYQDRYELDLPTAPMPGHPSRVATCVDKGESINSQCPYSGKEVNYFLEMEGTVYGFCNKSCRDKTQIDPEAWPAFMALVNNV